MIKQATTPNEAPNATITLVVPAAGCGARAALNGNKILAPLAGRPLLFHTLLNLLSPTEYGRNRPYSVCEVVVAARPEECPLIEDVWNSLRPLRPEWKKILLVLVGGGDTRQASVENAALVSSGDYLAVHDAARPLATHELLMRVCDAARVSGAAIPALKSSDTTKLAKVSNGRTVVAQTLARDAVWLVQTPQVFRREVLLEAFAHARATGFIGTDCASAVEQLRDEHGASRYEIALVEGETRNFKVTFAADLERAARLLEVSD